MLPDNGQFFLDKNAPFFLNNGKTTNTQQRPSGSTDPASGRSNNNRRPIHPYMEVIDMRKLIPVVGPILAAILAIIPIVGPILAAVVA